MKKKPALLPRGYRTVTTALAVENVPAAIAFYNDAFGAETCTRDIDEAPQFASIKLGNSMLFVTLGWPDAGHVPTRAGESTPVAVHIYVEDADASFEKAVAAGAKPVSFPQNTYWGERCATVSDPFGHLWTIATRLETLSADELRDRRNITLGIAPMAQEGNDGTNTEASKADMT